MNTSKIIISAISLASLMLPASLHAEGGFDINKVNLIVDWQMNAPFSTNFADNISGWGMNAELTYSITPHWDAGAFISFHTNHKYIGRQTLQLSPSESLTTDQLRSAYQLPFGLTSSYVLYDGRNFKPYAGGKIGAMFVRNTTYYGASGIYDKQYGFYVSPEIGVRIYPQATKKWGFHVAGYYSYATNKTLTLTHEIEGQNNVGFRLGMMF